MVTGDGVQLAPDPAYTAAVVALRDFAADVGDGTVVTALRPAIAAGVAVTAATAHIHRQALEPLADQHRRNPVTPGAFMAAAGAAALIVLAALAGWAGAWLLAGVCAFGWTLHMVGVLWMVRAASRARDAVVDAYDAAERAADG